MGRIVMLRRLYAGGCAGGDSSRGTRHCHHQVGDVPAALVPSLAPSSHGGCTQPGCRRRGRSSSAADRIPGRVYCSLHGANGIAGQSGSSLAEFINSGYRSALLAPSVCFSSAIFGICAARFARPLFTHTFVVPFMGCGLIGHPKLTA